MKNLFLLILFSLCGFGCATTHVGPDRIITVNSDLFPAQISRAEYYEQMALGYAQDNQYEKAIETYRLSLLHAPHRVSTHLNLSQAYREFDLEHLALYELGEVLKIEPQNKEAYYQLGDLYMSSHIYSKAREAYTELLKLDEHNSQAVWALFFIYKIEKKYGQSIRVLSQLGDQYDNKSEVAFQKSLIFKLAKNQEMYLQYLTDAYTLNPYKKNIVVEYAENLFMQKKFSEALIVLEKYTLTHDFELDISESLSYAAIQIENYDIALRELDKQRIWTNDLYQVDLKKAHIYFLQNDFTKAEKMYISLLKRKEADEARMYLAYSYQNQNKITEANETLEEISSSSEYFGEAQTRIALQEKLDGEDDLAMDRVRNAYMQRPDQLILCKTYADMLIEKKRYIESVSLLEKGIGFYPKDDELLLKMAFVHYRLNNQKSFRKQIAKAIQLNPDNAAIYSVLAELWYLKNKNAKEIEFFARKALALKTKNKNIRPLLAWALMEQSRSVEAISLFEQSYEENPKEHFYASTLAQAYGWGDVSTKAQEFLRLANNLEDRDSLRSRLIFKVQTKTVDGELLGSNPDRLPASLENH